jgi:hypothetical protein
LSNFILYIKTITFLYKFLSIFYVYSISFLFHIKQIKKESLFKQFFFEFITSPHHDGVVVCGRQQGVQHGKQVVKMLFVAHFNPAHRRPMHPTSQAALTGTPS